MRTWRAPGMLDRAPELLSAGRNFTGVCSNAIAVTTVDTIKLFDDVQIGEVVPVESELAYSGNCKGGACALLLVMPDRFAHFNCDN